VRSQDNESTDRPRDTDSLWSHGTESLCRHVSFRTPQDDPSLVRIFSSDDPELRIFPASWTQDEHRVRHSWFRFYRRH
jgi:hypothetical protein